MMNFRSKKSKVFVLLLALVMLVGVLAPSAVLAADVSEEDIIGITFEDSKSFTLIGEANNPDSNTHTVEVRGLSSSYEKVDLQEPDSVTWDVENATADNIVTVTPKENHSNIATITINGANEGYAKVVATYKGYKVHSNVFVEQTGEEAPSASNITVKVLDQNGHNPYDDIPPFDVAPKDLEINNTLKKSPTALHAILNWGKRSEINVEVSSKDGHVTKIGNDEEAQGENFYRGWIYYIERNGQRIDPEFGAGVYRLQDGDQVVFQFQEFTW